MREPTCRNYWADTPRLESRRTTWKIRTMQWDPMQPNQHFFLSMEKHTKISQVVISMRWGYTIIFPFVSVFSNFYTMKDLCDLKKKTALPANQLLRIHSSYTVSESESHSVMSDFLQPHGLYNPWNSPGWNTGVGSLSLLQGIFPTQGSNPGLPHCRRILYQLSHKGSPRIPEWVAYPFSRGSSRPRNRTGVSCTADWFFTIWAIREALIYS